MLLRGPQTLAELLTRTQRMFEFENIKAVEEKLEYLCAKTTPYFVRIPRAPNQREDRYMHLLCGQPDLAAIAAMSNSTKNHTPGDDERTSHLEQKVEQLEQQIKRLQQQVNVLMDLNGVSEADIDQ
jgi:uncharacterized protein YceH (UPF0502 family)